MIICPASFSAREKDWGGAHKQEAWMISQGLTGRLLSYYSVTVDQAESKNSFNFYRRFMRRGNKNNAAPWQGKVSLFIDSGAFSAWSKGVQIKLDEYIAFIKENIDIIDVYANLDVIGDAQATWKNQEIMEGQGLSPLPCFHYGEDFKWLKFYLDRGHDYIALGGMVPISSAALEPWLNVVFSRHICGEDGMPLVKIHGFGLTSLPLMIRYPWYSVDSTSWVMTSRMGAVYVPRFRSGEWIYNENPWKVSVSSRSPAKEEAGEHFDTLPPKAKEEIKAYFEQKNYIMGTSEFHQESKNYILRDNERWASKKGTDRRDVETIIQEGLCNSYKKRDELNVIYFLDLEKYLPAWPWAFKGSRRVGLGLM